MQSWESHFLFFKAVLTVQPLLFLEFMVRYIPFAVAGFLLALELARRAGKRGRPLCVGAARGSWIGFMAGMTFDAIVAPALFLMIYIRPDGCVVPIAESSDHTVVPILSVIFPAARDSCLSLVVETVAFFLVFIAVGVGVALVRGRRQGAASRRRLIMGGVYGLLTAGTIMPSLVVINLALAALAT